MIRALRGGGGELEGHQTPKLGAVGLTSEITSSILRHFKTGIISAITWRLEAQPLEKQKLCQDKTRLAESHNQLYLRQILEPLSNMMITREPN